MLQEEIARGLRFEVSDQDVEILLEGLDHPEGVAWGPDGHLYAGGEAGQLYRIETSSRSLEEFASIGELILGIALDADLNIYACSPGHSSVVRVAQSGTWKVYSSGSDDRDMVAPNYPVFTSTGRLFVSDCGQWDANDGCLFVVDPGGATSVWSTEASSFPNGLAMNQNESYVYVVESTGPRVARIPVLADGQAGRIEHVISLPGTVPDGLAFDDEGGLLISCYRPDRIYRLDPDGELAVIAEDPRGTTLSAPTNVCFGGPSLDTLFSANLGRWHISRIRTPFRGQALRYPALSEEAR